MRTTMKLLAVAALAGAVGCEAVEGGGEPLPSLDGPVEVATTNTGLDADSGCLYVSGASECGAKEDFRTATLAAFYGCVYHPACQETKVVIQHVCDGVTDNVLVFGSKSGTYRQVPCAPAAPPM